MSDYFTRVNKNKYAAFEMSKKLLHFLSTINHKPIQVQLITF